MDEGFVEEIVEPVAAVGGKQFGRVVPTVVRADHPVCRAQRPRGFVVPFVERVEEPDRPGPLDAGDEDVELLLAAWLGVRRIFGQAQVVAAITERITRLLLMVSQARSASSRGVKAAKAWGISRSGANETSRGWRQRQTGESVLAGLTPRLSKLYHGMPYQARRAASEVPSIRRE